MAPKSACPVCGREAAPPAKRGRPAGGPEQWLKPVEVAALLAVSRKQVYSYIASQQLRAYRRKGDSVRDCLRIAASDLEAFRRSNFAPTCARE